ncbi:hypothetical protein [Bacillus sp. MUM 13]|uniref:PcsB-like coiled-coil domain-containing protein n=1 Tax=Bacillus sp. MUM 13 TaxID=1678001 RepID=UPI0008F5858B|nr:hypothetical protein [Bacillus sp. MUM 13]OIK11694.1 hypothetical protein BIV59_11720 [Bacillus sp. MUM 13]
MEEMLILSKALLGSSNLGDLVNRIEVITEIVEAEQGILDGQEQDKNSLVSKEEGIKGTEDIPNISK